MKRLISSVFCILISSQVFADGTVTNVRVDEDGKGTITFSHAVPIQPACRAGAYDRFLAFDTNTVGGKNALAWALTAKATGSQIDAYGKGTCGIYLDENGNPYGIEDFRGLYIR